MPARPVLALVAALSVAGAAPAQGIDWRHDYGAARREAAAAGKPLLLDFGTENCVWCRRLDVTFQNPAVAALVAARYVAVKVDGDANPRLTEALSVTGFPTLILASPDGRVTGRHDGFLDPARMGEFLRSGLTSPAPAPAVQQAAAKEPTARERIAALAAAVHRELAEALDRK